MGVEYHCHECGQVLSAGDTVVIEGGTGRYWCGEDSSNGEKFEAPLQPDSCARKYVESYVAKHPSDEILGRGFFFGKLGEAA
jgi:hypothetical protein